MENDAKAVDTKVDASQADTGDQSQKPDVTSKQVSPENGTADTSGKASGATLDEELLKLINTRAGGVDRLKQVLKSQNPKDVIAPEDKGDDKKDEVKTAEPTDEQKAATPPTVKTDGVSPSELVFANYVANDLPKKFKNIPEEEFTDGTIVKKVGDYLKEFGVKMVYDNGNINVKAIETYLALYNASRPAPAPSDTISTPDSTPAKVVDNLEADLAAAKDIVFRQGSSHPQFAEAKKIVAKSIKL